MEVKKQEIKLFVIAI